MCVCSQSVSQFIERVCMHCIYEEWMDSIEMQERKSNAAGDRGTERWKQRVERADDIDYQMNT